jgi:L-threonylcarbamoyladenylate synthase
VIDDAVAAIGHGEAVILPTDTVYGLATTAESEDAVRELYALKGRAARQPTALLAADLETLFELVPELTGRSAAVARALLPGPYTLVLPNPAGRYPWLAGDSPRRLGVRVPELPRPTDEIVRRAGAVAATSANPAGGSDAARLEDVPQELRGRVAVAVDGGELPGRASTVLDFASPEPRVLREGAASGAEAIDRALAAIA